MYRTSTILSVFLVLGIASQAQAGPLEPVQATDHAVTSRFEMQASDFAETKRQAGFLGDMLERPISLTIPYQAPPTDLGTPDYLLLGELPPESLWLRIQVDPMFTFYVFSDLEGDVVPRLDAVDGDTYFATGLACHLTQALCLFVEDFQPASMVLGDAPEEAVPLRSWDGHQVSVGARWVEGSLTCEAAAVFSVLSASDRPSTVGAMASVGVRF